MKAPPVISPFTSPAFGSEVDEPVAMNPAQFAEDKRRRAKAGSDGLKEVESGERRQNQPRRMDKPGESCAKEDHRSGKKTHERFRFHGNNDYMSM